jgi:hypothetical protein
MLFDVAFNEDARIRIVKVVCVRVYAKSSV